MRTQYALSDGVSLAYQVLDGPGPTLIHIPGAISNLALEDGYPPLARWYERLTRFCRVVRFDKRGTGLSDRGARITTLDQQLVDVEAIRTAAGVDRAAVWGLSLGASLAALYAATFPERVSHLILVEGYCCDARDPYLPLSDENQAFEWDRILGLMDTDFRSFLEELAAAAGPDAPAAEHEALVDFFQATASPGAYRSIWQGMRGLDVRPMLRRIEAPTLVFHAKGDQVFPVQHGRYLAEHIPGARYVELNTSFHMPNVDERVAPEMMVTTEEFITGAVTHSAERRFVVVLFTDIVESTRQQQARGEIAWRQVRESFEHDTTRIVGQYGGRVAQFLGDGVMATFATPSDGLRAARALIANARAQGFEIRAGLHAGEAYAVEDDVHGLTVTMAARVSAQAGPGEILVSEGLRLLVEGFEFRFSDARDIDLKGLGPRRLLRLA